MSPDSPFSGSSQSASAPVGSAPVSTPVDDVAAIDELRECYARLRTELGRVIVGQDAVIEQLAICLFARGHSLLMGVPGLAKTLPLRYKTLAILA